MSKRAPPDRGLATKHMSGKKKDRFRITLGFACNANGFPIVTTHCLFEAVVALETRTRGLKAILLKDRGEEGARVCSKEKEQDKRQCNAGQGQSCTM